MAGKKIGIVLALDGEKQFSQGVSNAKKESAMLNSELKKLSTEYKGNANSLEFLTKKQENLSKQTESYQKRAESARKGLENAQKVSKKAAQRYEELSKALKEAEKAQENMQKSGKDGTKEYQQQSKEVESLQKAVERQGLECQKCEGKVSDWSKKVSDAENDIEKNNQALKQNEKYLQEAQNATDNCAKSINEYGKETTTVISTTKEFGESLKEGFGEALAAKGLELAGEAISVVADKAKEAAEYVVEVGSSFEAGMSKVEALSGATGSELDALQSKAQELGRSTQYSATEVADAFSYMALAGWNTDQMLSSISGVLSLAAASEMDLADASDIVTDYISAFGLEASDASHFVDVMATAMSKSNTDTEQLGEAYKNCASTAGAFGYSVEETTAAIMTMANSGVKGGEAGTALNAVMVRLATNTKGCADALKDYGVNIYDSDGNMRSLSEILTETAEAFSGLSDEQKANLAKIVAGQNQYSSFQTILNGMSDAVKESGQSFEDYTEQLQNCDGAAQDMMDNMQDNLKGDLKALDSAVEGLGIAAYSYIDGPLRAGAQGVTDIINGLTDVITPQKDAMKEMYDSVIQSSNEVADNVQAIDDQFTGTLDSVENVGALADRLEELNNVEDRTAVQKQEMAAIVDKLSQSIPELAGAYDSENDKLNVTNDELEKLVKNYQDVAVQQALVKATQDLVDQSLEAQKVKDQAEEQKEIVEKKLDLLKQELELNNRIQNERSQGNWDSDYRAEALKLYEQALKDGAITLEEYQQAEKNLANDQLENRFAVLTGQVSQSGDATGILATSIEELADQEDELNGVIDTQNQTLEENEKKKEDYTESAEKLIKTTKNGTDATEDSTEAQEENVDAINATGVAAIGAQSALEGFNKTMERSQEAADAAKTAMRQILDEYTSTMDSIKADLQDKISFADKFDGGDDITTEQMNENLQSWVDGIQNYQQNLQRIKEATDESGKAIFSAEFIQAIQDQGTDAANMLQHMVWTLDNQGEYGVEQLKGISKKWTDAMDISEDTATVMAANKTAYELAMGDLGSSDIDFSDLRESIDNAVASAVEGWAELPTATQETLMQTVQLAQECGVQIPEGLADGIASGEITPQQAIDQLNGTIEGTIQGVAEIANKAGIRIPEEIQAGINSGGTQAVSAMQELLALIQQQAADAQSAGEDVGTAVGEGTQSSIKDQQSGVEQAGGEMASAGAKAAEEKKGEYEKAGSVAAQQYQTGINSGKSGAISTAGTMASQAASAVRAYQNSFYSAGYNVAAGVAQGIAGGQSLAVNAAANMVRAALASAKAAADIHSPSKKFEKEVGYQIPAGTAAGIVNNTKVATTAAGKMSAAVLKNATSWLANYNKSHEVSLDNERWYWQQIRDTAVKGSSAYKTAVSQLNKLDSESTITNALSSKLKNNFGVSRTKTTGSGKNKKTTKKDANTYNSEILTAAEKQLSQYQTLHATSLEQEKNYWINIRKHLKSNTEAWYESTRKIQDLDTQIYEEKQKKEEEAVKTRASVQKSLLETYQTYYSMSAKAEMEYWDIARKQFTAGTDERIEADQKYLEAKKDYEKQKLELDDNYKEQREKLEKELNENIQDLEEKRENAVADRKKDILSSMNNYDAWDASGYTSDRLIYNMKTQVEGLKLWESQLQELSGKGLSEGLLQELKDAGPEAAANIYSLNEMTEEQLDEFNKLWEEKQNIAERQAKKDTQATWDSIGQQIDELKKTEEKEKSDLKAEYDKSLAELNEGLSTGLKSLVEKAGQIGEDIVGSLIAGIQKAGTGGTLLDVKVTPNGSPTSSAASSGSSGASASGTTSSGSTSSGKSTSEVAPAQNPALADWTGAAAEEPDAAKEIRKLINASKSHKKSVSASEKKKHSDLWQYITKKYGRSVTNDTIKDIAYYLGVNTSKKPTSKQKSAILAAMKKKGLRTGTQNIVEDQLAWLFENNAQEYVLRKSDGAIMQNMLTGDKVINPQGAENLYNFAMNPDRFLENRSSLDVSAAGIEKLNKLIRQQSERQAKLSGRSQVDNSDILNKMDSMMKDMESTMASMVSAIQNMSLTLDTGAVVGGIRERLNTDNEMAATRRTRGRLR